MKKIVAFLSIFVLCMVVLATHANAERNGATLLPSASSKPAEQMLRGEDTFQSNLLKKAQELQKRELRVNNIASNSAEALKTFQQKTVEAKKLRLDCLKARAVDIKNLETIQRASGSAGLMCSPKVVAATIQKPVQPTLDGLSSVDKNAARSAFQAAVKTYYTQVQEAMKTCKTKAEQTRLEMKEKIIAIKEQCSNTERSVLGLSTEIPYNAQ